MKQKEGNRGREGGAGAEHRGRGCRLALAREDGQRLWHALVNRESDEKEKRRDKKRSPPLRMGDGVGFATHTHARGQEEGRGKEGKRERETRATGKPLERCHRRFSQQTRIHHHKKKPQ
jgi:hypothetical protein